jgi:hypothetical protein
LFLGFEHFITVISWLYRIMVSVNSSWRSLSNSPHNHDDLSSYNHDNLSHNVVPTDEISDEMSFVHMHPPLYAVNASSVPKNLRVLVPVSDVSESVAVVLFSTLKEPPECISDISVGMIH